ncbi:MAG: DUF4399 domain-containing protein [Vicinamibacterales bacterium]|nr:DUF4399 domain-containing protein [Vicinamibacterales bacterium]
MYFANSGDMAPNLKVWLTLAVFVTVGAVACGGGSSGGEAESAAGDAATAAPRVFFVAPIDETDHPTEIPLGLTFGVENFQISAVPDEVVSPREGLGHYHLGFNTECLPAGEIIPAADPWTHFGDGSDGMEMQLEGGEYRFSVQIGDDEHRTIEGLCDTIVIRMEDGI